MKHPGFDEGSDKRESGSEPSMQDNSSFIRKTIETTVPEDHFSLESLVKLLNTASLQQDHTQTAETSGSEVYSENSIDYIPVIDQQDLKSNAPIGLGEGMGFRYRVGEKLGTGGSSLVFNALDTDFNREVAIKVLNPSKKRDRRKVERFMNEARISAELDHPGILPVYDIGFTKGGEIFFTMKKVQGVSLGNIIHSESEAEAPEMVRTVKDKLNVFIRVCDAVIFAHDKGIVHQDIKPDNIMIGEYGEVHLVDWGTASTEEDIRSRRRGLIGTPVYMSPEQARKEGADKRSDIYCLASTLYHFLLHRYAVSSEIMEKFWEMKKSGEIKPFTEEERGRVSPIIEEILMKGMAPVPEDRFSGVREFQQALKNYLSHIESIELVSRAEEYLADASETGEYEKYIRAQFGFEQASEVWSENKAARQGLEKTICSYAECAIGKGDLELGLSLLDSSNPLHRSLIEQAEKIQADLERARFRSRIMYITAVFLALCVAAGVIYYVVDYFRYFGDWQEIYSADFTDMDIEDMRTQFDETDIQYDRRPLKEFDDGLHLNLGGVYWLPCKAKGNVRVETVCMWTKNVDGFEVFLNSRFGGRTQVTFWWMPAGYGCQFGGFKGSETFISRNDKVAIPGRGNTAAYSFKSNQVYRLVFERMDETVSMYVDGEKILELYDPLPLAGEGFDRIALRTWAGGFAIQELKVSRMTLPEKTSPVIAGDILFERGYTDDAVKTYLSLAEDFPGSEIAEKSLTRAYFALLKSETDFQKEKKLILETMEMDFPESRYRQYLLEAEAVSYWNKGEYDSAFGLMERLFRYNPDTRVILHMLAVEHNPLSKEHAAELLKWIARTKNVNRIGINRLGITDLSPLSGMKLSELLCNENEITSLAPLKGMPLRVLKCTVNRIEDLSTLQGMPLEVLECHRNQIKDLSGLKGLPLDKLDISHNDVSDLSPLSSLKLRILSCGGNLITDLSPLSGVPLKTLKISRNPVTDLTPIKNSGITRIECQKNRLKSLESIRGMKLTFLDCSVNEISDLSPLKGMPLVRLDCSRNMISDLTPLKGMPLKNLTAGNNPISDISPLKGMPLDTLTCSNTSIKDLTPLSEAPLKILVLDNTRVSDLTPVSSLSLVRLDCADTSVSDLSPLKGMTELNTVYANNARITSLEPLGASAPEIIHVIGNPLETLAPFESKPPGDLLFFNPEMNSTYIDSVLDQWEKTDPEKAHDCRVLDALFRKDKDKLLALSTEFGGSRYVYVRYECPWEKARSLAETVGGHLPIIQSREEDMFILNFLPQRFAEGTFIGILINNGSLKWLNGEPLDYDSHVTRADRESEFPRWIDSCYLNTLNGLWQAVKRGDSPGNFMIEWEIENPE